MRLAGGSVDLLREARGNRSKRLVIQRHRLVARGKSLRMACDRRLEFGQNRMHCGAFLRPAALRWPILFHASTSRGRLACKFFATLPLQMVAEDGGGAATGKIARLDIFSVESEN